MGLGDIPNTYVEDRVRFVPLFDCIKHGLSDNPEAMVTLQIDNMSNSQFLSAVSEAIEERLSAFENELVVKYHLHRNTRF